LVTEKLTTRRMDMLVLSRKKDESIVIGDIVITVLEIRAGKVRIGIEAPAEVAIFRKELLESKAMS